MPWHSKPSQGGRARSRGTAGVCVCVCRICFYFRMGFHKAHKSGYRNITKHHHIINVYRTGWTKKRSETKCLIHRTTYRVYQHQTKPGLEKFSHKWNFHFIQRLLKIKYNIECFTARLFFFSISNVGLSIIIFSCWVAWLNTYWEPFSFCLYDLVAVGKVREATLQ